MSRVFHKHSIAFWIILGVASTNAQVHTEQSVPDIVKRSSDAVVQIVTSDSLGKEMALGSGFIVSAEGRIVTNYHVIKGAHSAVVKLTNGASFQVQGVLAADPDQDLAVLKVSGQGLTFLTFSQNKTQVGEHVIAIGSPLGLQNTVSDGIISAIREENNHQWVQTTAPVSHGNSGGPLMDSDGAVVGVITWGVNLQLGQNLNFAASSPEVQRLLTQVSDVRSLDAAQPATTTPNTETTPSIWTSLTTGHDYSIRLDGDYFYSDRVNMPKELQGSGAFNRSEAKKGADGCWHGVTRAFFPCNYRGSVKWCHQEQDWEIDMLSKSRIEGKTLTGDFDCGKCAIKNPRQQSFSWIPK